jgi:hypothetical protein
MQTLCANLSTQIELCDPNRSPLDKSETRLFQKVGFLAGLASIVIRPYYQQKFAVLEARLT